MFSAQFGPLVTAMVTPFKQDLSIDYPALEKLIEHLIDTGTTSVLITGTTGENPTLAHEEEWELLQKTKAIAQKRVPVIFGAGSNCTNTAVQVSLKAQELGADAVLSVVPYYNKPNQEGIHEHFSAVAKAVKIPIILYNNPGRTCSQIELGTIAKLVNSFGNIGAIKESSGSLDLTSQLRLQLPKLDIYCGDDNLILPSLAIGAVGVVSVASHLVGERISSMVHKFLAGKISEAATIHSELYPLFKGIFASPSPGPVKYLLSELGICKQYLRLPLTPPAKDVRDSLNQIMSDLKLRSMVQS
jgi:4-hydroxy-tetrahydrodipicolinate synthase